MGAEKNRVYKPRSGASNKNQKYYTKEMLDHMWGVNEDMNHIFGYADMSNDPEFSSIPNVTPFVDYKGKASEENRKRFRYFKKLNEIAMERRLRLKHGEMSAKE